MICGFCSQALKPSEKLISQHLAGHGIQVSEQQIGEDYLKQYNLANEKEIPYPAYGESIKPAPLVFHTKGIRCGRCDYYTTSNSSFGRHGKNKHNLLAPLAYECTVQRLFGKRFYEVSFMEADSTGLYASFEALSKASRTSATHITSRHIHPFLNKLQWPIHYEAVTEIMPVKQFASLCTINLSDPNLPIVLGRLYELVKDYFRSAAESRKLIDTLPRRLINSDIVPGES